MRIWVALAAFGLSLFFASNADALPRSWNTVDYSAANWCAQAEANLQRNGIPFRCADQTPEQLAAMPLCIRLNNYWCQKHGNSAWRGTADANGANGARDNRGHARFEEGAWSVRAIAIDLRAKYRRGLISAVQIAAAHSPWCDTLGSRPVVQGAARTCSDGEQAPADHAGPLCRAPTTPNPSEADCVPGCNCPPSIAQGLVSGLTVSINGDLELFDAGGRPQPNLNIVLANLSRRELGSGFSPSSDFIALGLTRLN